MNTRPSPQIAAAGISLALVVALVVVFTRFSDDVRVGTTASSHPPSPVSASDIENRDDDGSQPDDGRFQLVTRGDPAKIQKIGEYIISARPIADERIRKIRSSDGALTDDQKLSATAVRILEISREEEDSINSTLRDHFEDCAAWLRDNIEITENGEEHDAIATFSIPEARGIATDRLTRFQNSLQETLGNERGALLLNMISATSYYGSAGLYPSQVVFENRGRSFFSPSDSGFDPYGMKVSYTAGKSGSDYYFKTGGDYKFLSRYFGDLFRAIASERLPGGELQPE